MNWIGYVLGAVVLGGFALWVGGDILVFWGGLDEKERTIASTGTFAICWAGWWMHTLEKRAEDLQDQINRLRDRRY